MGENDTRFIESIIFCIFRNSEQKAHRKSVESRFLGSEICIASHRVEDSKFAQIKIPVLYFIRCRLQSIFARYSPLCTLPQYCVLT